MNRAGLARLAETLSRLRPSQPAHRLVRLVRARRGAASPAGPAVRAAGLPPLPPEARRPLAFPFDHETERGWRLGGGDVARAADSGVDWDATAPTRLALFHAHYLDWVRGLAETGDLARAGAAARSWAAARGRFPEDARHPYARSRRILALIEGAALGVPGLEATVAEDAAALAAAVERDVGGNHLLCNAAALFRAGHALSGPPAARWRALGASLLSACARGQVLYEGVHYERSPVYHALSLEHFLTALETAAASGLAPPRGVENAVARMAPALVEMVLPDGDLLRSKDGVPGLALPAAALLAWANRRAGPFPAPRTGTRLFPAAGLAVLAVEAERSAATFLAGPPCPRDLPAHGHADALAYEAVLDGRRVVASAGTSTYAPGPERDAERLPGAFAGTLLGGVPPADPYGAFRVGARGTVRPLVRVRSDEGTSVSAVSDGFLAMGQGSFHRRALWLGPGPALACVDEWTGEGSTEAVLFWPLAPGLDARVSGDSALVTGGGATWRLTAPGVALSLERGRFATALGTTLERVVIRGTTTLALPARRAHAWTPGAAEATVTARPMPRHELVVDVVAGGRAWSAHVPSGTAA